jgi:hypothetical protein
VNYSQVIGVKNGMIYAFIYDNNTPSKLESRMAVLLGHLLKWQYQPGYRSNSWARTIKEQKRGKVVSLSGKPSSAVQMELIVTRGPNVAPKIRFGGLLANPSYAPYTLTAVRSYLL